MMSNRDGNLRPCDGADPAFQQEGRGAFRIPPPSPAIWRGSSHRHGFRGVIEDEFDIIITMNMQAEIETVGQLADAVRSCRNERGVAAVAAPATTPRRISLQFDALIAEREALLATGVRDPFAIVMDQVLSPTEAVIRASPPSCSAPTTIWA